MSHLGRLVFTRRIACVNTCMKIFRGQRKTFSSSSVNHEEYQTMATVRQKLLKTLDADVSFSRVKKSREKLLKYLAGSQESLPPRKMKASFDQALIPLSKEMELRDKYTTVHGNVRFGRLMEDLDMFAVWCCVKHICGDVQPGEQPFPYIVVTIRVDEIEIFSSDTQTTSDIRISGHVTWVGKSSIEVCVWMDHLINGNWVKTLRSLVLMAARDAVSSGAAFVNPVEAETPEEKELLLGGETRRKKRLQFLQMSPLTTVPTTEELTLIHDLFVKTVEPNEVFLRSRILPPKSKWMDDALLSTILLCHPEHRNIYNKIFGGFLVRQALELAWCVAATYGFKIPKLVHISDISFYSPVDVGSLLKVYAGITYTEKQYMQIFVYAEAYTFTSGKSGKSGKSTTSFNFLFHADTPVDQIFPSTYLDAMRYIDGRRRFLQAMNGSSTGAK